jgi:hypothetical protein
VNKNNSISIAKSLINNNRLYGASVMLASSPCYSYKEFLQLSALYDFCIFALRKLDGAPAHLAVLQAEQKITELKGSWIASANDLSISEKFEIWCELVVWAPTMTSSMLATYIDVFYEQYPSPSEVQAYELLINCSTVKSVSSAVAVKLDILIDLLSVAKLRELDVFFGKLSCIAMREFVLKALINKAQTVNWEYYNLAQILAKFGRHERALDSYKAFFDKALVDNQANVMKTALSGALNSVLYVENIEEYCDYFLGKCPKEILNAPELANIKMEVSAVIDSRRVFNECKTLLNEEIGFHYFDLTTVNRMYVKALELAEVHPSYKLFYRLFKICSVLNKYDEAKFWLKQSAEANVLMFKVGR